METSPSGGNLTIIERVLRLRKQMGIDNGLSVTDPRGSLFLPSEGETSECSMNVPCAHNHRVWIDWPDADPDPSPGPGPT